MDLNLAGKVAVVTGAGKGIGMATTLALADEGAHVIAGSRTTGTLDGLKGVTPVAVDLTAADGPAQLIRHATEEHGRIDVLVNNVGAVRMRTEGFFGTSDEDFAWAMQMNFFIALRASRVALTEMVKNGSGAIVNVASVNAASMRSPQAPSPPTCGWASRAWPRPWPRPPGWTPKLRDRRSSPGSAGSPPGASPLRRRSPR
jgi:NAD(P)-dependent dehydrogenase (short-subunit alcohol dehydrogenase family)